MQNNSVSENLVGVNFYKHKDPLNQNFWTDVALSDWLIREGVSEILIANSFIKNSGINFLKERFKHLIEHGTTIKVLYGEDFGITEASAIRHLVNIGCVVKVCKIEGVAGFHPKFLIINYTDSKSILCAGSSNLTSGGLKQNIEFNISINHERKYLKDSISFFNNLWDKSEEIDEDYLLRYEILEKIQKRYDPIEIMIPTPDKELLTDYIDSWLNKVPDKKKIEGCLEWRGWYLFPEHGNLNDDKMTELKKICEALYLLCDNNKVIKIDNSQAGLNKVADVLEYASISYTHRYDIQTKRAWLVRQQVNYLEKLKLIQRIRTGLYQVKPLGEDFINLNSSDLRKFYTQRVEEIGWAWGNIKYVSFLKKLLLLFPDKRIFEKEFSYFVSHSHYNEELLYIFELISKFRSLNNRVKYIQDQDRRIKDKIINFRTPNAHSHYLSKTKSLMKDLGYCLNFETKHSKDHLYISIS